MDFQREKELVRAYHKVLDRGEFDAAARHEAPECRWRGYHPFNEMTGAKAVAARFWKPLRAAFSNLQRREDIFFAGQNQIDGLSSVWVVSMGHLVGLFDAPWLGIPPTRRMAFLRYGTFLRVENDTITDIAMYFDIPHLMIQAGLAPFKEQAGAHLVQPGPATHDGLLYDPQPAEAGKATLAAMNAMIADLGTWQLGLPLEEELARSWHPDMIWWGPAGIGSSYTITRYAEQHAGPFRAAFSDRSSTGHIARLAEGHYGGFFGWPNFTAVRTGSFLGHEPTNALGEFRVIDVYRRVGDKLAENWVFIDMPHFWLSQGVTILPREAGEV